MVAHSSWSSSLVDRTLVIELAGEIDCANADDLRLRVRLELEEVPADRVVLDLGGVSFIDSAGVRMLLHTKRAVEAHGAAFGLRSLQPQAQRLLEVTGLVEHFDPGATGADPPWPRSSL